MACFWAVFPLTKQPGFPLYRENRAVVYTKIRNIKEDTYRHLKIKKLPIQAALN